MTKYSGRGWYRQSIRHSNARKYGRAGGKYSDNWRYPKDLFSNKRNNDLTSQDQRNIKNFHKIAKKHHLTNVYIVIPDHQRIRGVFDENTEEIALPHDSPDDLLAHEMAHALEYEEEGETNHDKEFHEIQNELIAEIPS